MPGTGSGPPVWRVLSRREISFPAPAGARRLGHRLQRHRPAIPAYGFDGHRPVPVVGERIWVEHGPPARVLAALQRQSVAAARAFGFGTSATTTV
jgi:hypothetical protein